MSPECEYVWSIFHVLWSFFYVVCGAAQLVAGIFFFISVPTLNLSNNLWIGIWNVLIGISVGMVACFGKMSPLRQEVLLYMSVSILITNTMNALYNEWNFYNVDVLELIRNNSYQTLIKYAFYGTRFSSGAIIIMSFVDSQLSFCSMQFKPGDSDKVKLSDTHEQVSDIEYIIPRPKSSKSSIISPYSQSWVYESTNNQNDQTSYLKISQNGTPQVFKKLDLDVAADVATASGQDAPTAHVIDNPVVHIEEASDDSTSNSDRKLCHMKSFSPSASPIVLSASSSQLSLNQSHHAVPIYECLEKLTNPTIYRQRLHSTLSNKSDNEPHYHAPQAVAIKRTTPSPKMEKVQYASLMRELQRAIVCKKEPSAVSPPSKSESVNSKSSSSRHESSSRSGKSSDAEFSKELEAALQLIQDLESPNTIDTPSEPKSSLDGKDLQPLTVWKEGANGSDNTSEKTLSPCGSMAELSAPIVECQPAELLTFKPASDASASSTVATEERQQQQQHRQGKRMLDVIAANVVHNSTSTSGYCSPTNRKSASRTPNCWSTASSISDIGTGSDQLSSSSSTSLSSSSKTYIIHNTKSTAVISLYAQDASQQNLKSVSLVTISGNNETIAKIKGPARSGSSEALAIASGDGVVDCNDSKSRIVDEDDDGDGDEEGNRDGEVDERDDNNNTEYGANGNNTNSKAMSYVKSLLRKKNTAMPKLRPELEDAIVKSESLAYLTKNELVARHQQNSIILREIEQRVLQQLRVPRAESNC